MGAGAGQTTGQEAADVVDLGTRPHVVGEDDVVVTARFGESVGENRTGAAESEYRLIGVGGDDRGCGAGTDQFEQVRGLRVEVLGVVDDEVPDAAPLLSGHATILTPIGPTVTAVVLSASPRRTTLLSAVRSSHAYPLDDPAIDHAIVEALDEQCRALVGMVRPLDLSITRRVPEKFAAQ